MINTEKSVSEAQLYREYLSFYSYHVNPPSFNEWKATKEQPFTKLFETLPLWKERKHD